MTVREFINSKRGRTIAAALSIAALVIVFFVIRAELKSKTPDSAFYRMYICSETGKVFRHKNRAGETIPILSPFSGQNTGYPAEACYWNADGTIKDEPTWVLMNGAIDKPGPTFCPDCGRLVIVHNPKPGPQSKPPPTQSEYAERHAANDRDGVSHNDADR